jgi:oligopeptidase B
MKFILQFTPLFITGIFLMIIGGCNTPSVKEIKPPVADKIKKDLVIHGDIRTDYYYWLNERDNPEVIAYLEAENAYTTEMMKHTEAFREEIYQEIVGRIKQTDMSVPYRLNGYDYFTRYEEGKEYPVYCRKKAAPEAEEDVMLNVNEMAAGYSFYDIEDWEVSPDNKLIAYSVDTFSRRQYTIYIKNLETGKETSDIIGNTSGPVTWANDNKSLFYVEKDETLRPYKIYRHTMGENKTGDILVYHEPDTTFGTLIYKTKSKKYLIIEAYSTLSSEFRFLNADNPAGDFTIFQPREADLLYDIDHYNDTFFIRTNLEAKNFRLMKTPIARTGKENWSEVIPHRQDVYLDDFELFNGYLVVSEKIKGLDQLRIININTKEDFFIGFEEPAYSLSFSDNPEFNTTLLRFSYTSLTTPNTIYDFNLVTKERMMLKQQEVLGNYKDEDYVTERLFAVAADSVKVPVTIVYKKGLVRNGKNPLFIEGYGSYGYSSDPSFSAHRITLLDRGFIFAIAHVRGGQELGRQWYEDGKLLKKKNTFTDFIACTEFLIRENFTSPEYCFAWGGSAGGLLMGAIANMRPDLYKGIIAPVPFVDVVTTMLDESIPLTTGEYDEWGNPYEKVYYDYMLSYSPYDNVKAMNYPALLVTTGLHDSQVQYWEPAKWVAKLRSMKTDNNPLFLFTEMEYGHGGASGRFETYREIAREYAFIFDLIGIKK